jgi:hypothetical protein
MNKNFDELTKKMAQSVTRRGALKQFGIGLGGAALAVLSFLPRLAHAGGQRCTDCVQACMAQGYSKQYCRDVECGLVCHKPNPV